MSRTLIIIDKGFVFNCNSKKMSVGVKIEFYNQKVITNLEDVLEDQKQYLKYWGETSGLTREYLNKREILDQIKKGIGLSKSHMETLVTLELKTIIDSAVKVTCGQCNKMYTRRNLKLRKWKSDMGTIGGIFFTCPKNHTLIGCSTWGRD